MIKVKICGITNLEDALFSSETGADALGFIFSKKSPRFINPKDAKKIISSLDPYIVKVGVFLNQLKEEVLEIANFLSLDVLQFHGDETQEYCNFFRKKFKVIKVFFPDDRPFKDRISKYKVDAYMFDIRYEDKTNIKTLPKDALKEISDLIKEGYRVILSGGINLKNVSSFCKLRPYALDVASGVEKFVGKKDKELVSLFIKSVKNEGSR